MRIGGPSSFFSMYEGKNKNSGSFLPEFPLVPFAFSSGLRFFLSFHAGLFIMLMFSDFSHHASFLAGAFKTAECAV